MKRKKLLLVLTIGVLLVVAGIAANYRTFVAAYITRSALEDATVVAERVDWDGDCIEKAGVELREEYKVWFERGFFDVTLFLDQLPARGVSRDSLPIWFVAGLYWHFQNDRIDAQYGDLEKSKESAMLIVPWVEAVCIRPRLKEVLVSALIDDYEMITDLEQREGGLPKLFFFEFLFLRESDDFPDTFFSRKSRDREIPGLVIDRLEPRFWDAVVRDLRHDRERVRAGAGAGAVAFFTATPTQNERLPRHGDCCATRQSSYDSPLRGRWRCAATRADC